MSAREEIAALAALADAAAALLDESPGEAYESAANKALWWLGKGLDVVELPGGGFLIPSGTTAGKIYQVSLTTGCNCAARGPCWHYACVVIVEWARGKSAMEYEKACAEIEELFA